MKNALYWSKLHITRYLVETQRLDKVGRIIKLMTMSLSLETVYCPIYPPIAGSLPEETGGEESDYLVKASSHDEGIYPLYRGLPRLVKPSPYFLGAPPQSMKAFSN